MWPRRRQVTQPMHHARLYQVPALTRLVLKAASCGGPLVRSIVIERNSLYLARDWRVVPRNTTTAPPGTADVLQAESHPKG